MHDATAIVLAGGRSKRMGINKAFLDFDGKPLIARLVDMLRQAFAEVLLSANTPQPYAFLGVEIVADEPKDAGPLGAIISCLAKSSRELNFVMGCDMPFVRLDLVHSLVSMAAQQHCDAVIPQSSEGLYEPLLAVYKRSALEPARALLARGNRRVLDLAQEIRALHPMIDRQSAININTPEDYAAALAAWRQWHDPAL
ncbi:MAG TPA: molybdenum cofactor guanylyltransferase [Polyangiaceae bacterium]|nr:MAG: putative molybdenum cofactor guanylyltransferase [Deltaproteobacteria bacterium ADurb.Bin207]HNS95638.1 molybdenum cofactor guanylyltransferase [Polyangiaceae bacterium]HOE50865.1 molybdenum cofactor guanylyltransferase [Polyangiaceae bacterium]HOH03370.1 molybdenum cofactor guanylyltransferase [Polyangiaceae bacterium]HOT12006.1 molybdenum cofactor guanylyltransferase [Polyangiaceae bacterium]